MQQRIREVKETLKSFPLADFVCDNCKRSFEENNPYSFAETSQDLKYLETFCSECVREFDKQREISLSKKQEEKPPKSSHANSPIKKVKKMSKIKKTKKLPVAVKKTKTNPAKSLVKPRSVRSKENTLNYFGCMFDQVANPLNNKVKITQMSHHCRFNKGKVAVAKQVKKQQLVKEVAQNYLAFGQSLGNLLHANITGCKCK
jgi:hypothetical protein